MVLLVSAILLILVVCILIKLWYHPLLVDLGARRLPPGSMGWPYIGETLQLYSQNPNIFFSDKQKRYGDVVKTHILGCPCVMIASPEATKFVLVKNAHLFKPTFPSSKERLLGRNALFFQQGEFHARLRKAVQSSLLPQAIRSIVADIDETAQAILKMWEGQTVITFQEMKKYAFEVGIFSIFGPLNPAYKEDLKKQYRILEEGYNSLAVNLPGTPFNKSLKAREKLGEIVSKIITERRSMNVPQKHLLQSLLAYREETGEGLNEEQITDNVIGVFFAAQDTIASILTWLVKFLAEYPEILDAVTAEQEDIQRSKTNKEDFLTMEDIKKMPVTTRVIQETLRVATVLSFTFREAVEDVEYKGFTIPKGWKVMPLFRNVHHNPEFFPDPQQFNPSRFLVPPKPNTFMPFGNGVHSCPGQQLAYTEILILIHRLTIEYRWKEAGTENGIEYSPFPIPKQGFPIKVVRKCTEDRSQSKY
ncbi:hypothetical protein SUGI_0808680 [Cryptomeria japonica]|uniref:abscisic acid 8'-hydroxylase CYP707A2 n=1 Tax=Cryptomeria japonica TaxID=3369 RepID=UPI002414A602|nr:abscisic acid 8'-hydroxylase CYP707A2 [Cryptomeria japonica]GLJ39578.1 hypothetical protein SUGI_0808680 [Cryptomeria japonica]